MDGTAGVSTGGDMGYRRITSAGARLVALLVVAVGVLGATALPAGAADAEVTGDWTATGQLLSGCGAFHQIVDGTGDWTTLGTSALHLDFCIAGVGVGEWPAAGTFSIGTATGGLTGDLSGWVKTQVAEPEGYPLHLVLSVTGGSGDLTGATGELVLDGWFGLGALTAFGTVSGSLTLPDPMPQSKDDCKQGGWRDLVDDQGEPFRNQGHCIAWVVSRPG